MGIFSSRRYMLSTIRRQTPLLSWGKQVKQNSQTLSLFLCTFPQSYSKTTVKVVFFIFNKTDLGYQKYI